MKIKQLKFILLILCIVFFAGFNYFSFAASDDGSSGKSSIANIDSDKDGLSDTEEALYGTAVDVADTDGDGYSDGVEVKSGYDPLRPAPGDKLTVENTAASVAQTTSSATDLTLTDSFTADFQAFLASKNGQTISTADIQNFTETALAGKVNATDFESIPTVERSQLKIKPQNYAALSVADKKKVLQKDAAEYLNQILYLLISNAPITIATAEEFSVFQADFLNRLTAPSDPENLVYFAELATRLDAFSQQLNTVEVPETMVDLHLKFVKIINGCLSLRNKASLTDASDPMGNMITLTRANNLLKIFSDFLINDFQVYFKQIGLS